MRNIDLKSLRPSTHVVDSAGVIATPVTQVFVFAEGAR
jgi:hypothetical protein